jgi:hypothetical protein
MATETVVSEPQAARREVGSSAWREILLIIAISVLLLIPCFWHAHIEAGDLGSHVYNAWLAQLIEKGQAPGLYIVRQWDNVLFDTALLNFANLFGLALAEKLAVSLCVLVFFWGSFGLMKAVSSRTPWYLTPCIAMLTYGHVFHLGFMNYYLSVGLACIGLALMWPLRRNGLIASVLIAPVMLLAHPLGLLWFLGGACYRVLWMKLPGRWKIAVPVAAIGLCAAARWYIAHAGYEVQWREVPLWRMTGADQFHVFGLRYMYFTRGFLALAVVSTLLAVVRFQRSAEFWRCVRLPWELYVVSFVATTLLPENMHVDPTGGWIGELATRLTLVTAIFGLCCLAALPARRWYLFAYGALALLYFFFIYQDTSFMNRMEANAEKVTRRLPFGTRAAATIYAPGDYRTPFLHIPDRACVGHCFLVSNYEPSTKQFRIRVREGSPVVTASVDDSEDMQAGDYDVQEEDLPLKQIYQCDERDLTQICIRDLAADEKNGSVGYNAPPKTPATDNWQLH